jgi:hypothetical protein
MHQIIRYCVSLRSRRRLPPPARSTQDSILFFVIGTISASSTTDVKEATCDLTEAKQDLISSSSSGENHSNLNNQSKRLALTTTASKPRSISGPVNGRPGQIYGGSEARGALGRLPDELNEAEATNPASSSHRLHESTSTSEADLDTGAKTKEGKEAKLKHFELTQESTSSW